MRNKWRLFSNLSKAVDSIGKEMMENDFKRRIPYWSYRAADYQAYEPFMEYKTQLDKHLEKLFQGELDDGNGDVLDNMIQDMERQAQRELAGQRTEHRDTIKSFDIRFRSDRKAFESQLLLLKEQLEINRQEQEKYSVLVNANETRLTIGGEEHE